MTGPDLTGTRQALVQEQDMVEWCAVPRTEEKGTRDGRVPRVVADVRTSAHYPLFSVLYSLFSILYAPFPCSLFAPVFSFGAHTGPLVHCMRFISYSAIVPGYSSVGNIDPYIAAPTRKRWTGVRWWSHVRYLHYQSLSRRTRLGGRWQRVDGSRHHRGWPLSPPISVQFMNHIIAAAPLAK